MIKQLIQYMKLLEFKIKERKIMKNFIRENRRPLELMTEEEYNKGLYNSVMGEATQEQTKKVYELFNLDKKVIDKALFPHDFKKGGLDLLEKAVAENLLDPSFLYVGTEAVNFDPAELIDFIIEHGDEEITVLYDVWPNKSQSVRIDGIAFKKDVSEKTIADLEIFRKKISKENKANKGRKYQTKEYIVCRWDKGAFVTKARDFHWA